MSVIPTPALVHLTGEPLTLAEAKLFLRQDLPNDDALITSLISAAREWFEVACDRQFVTATWEVKLPGFYPGAMAYAWPVSGWVYYGRDAGLWSRIHLPYPPLQSVGSVQYLELGTNSTLTLSTSVYNVVTSRTPGCIELAFGQTWPVTAEHPEAVTITYTAGYGTASSVPEMVKNGIKLLLAHWYDHRGDTTEVPKAVEAIAIAAGAKRF